jgi:L-rhamnose isomerase
MRDLAEVKNALRSHQIELPSWAFGNSKLFEPAFYTTDVPD